MWFPWSPVDYNAELNLAFLCAQCRGSSLRSHEGIAICTPPRSVSSKDHIFTLFQRRAIDPLEFPFVGHRWRMVPAVRRNYTPSMRRDERKENKRDLVRHERRRQRQQRKRETGRRGPTKRFPASATRAYIALSKNTRDSSFSFACTPSAYLPLPIYNYLSAYGVQEHRAF